MRPTVTDFTTLYIGVQAMLLFQGTRVYTFTLGVFSCNPNDLSPLPPRPSPAPLLPSGLTYTPLTLSQTPLAAHVAAGVVSLFTFKAAPTQTSGTFRITVIEDNPNPSNLQRNALRVVARAGAAPSLATFDVASPDIKGTFTWPTHTLVVQHTHDDVWVGVFGLSQSPQLHEFHVQVVCVCVCVCVCARARMCSRARACLLCVPHLKHCARRRCCSPLQLTCQRSSHCRTTSSIPLLMPLRCMQIHT